MKKTGAICILLCLFLIASCFVMPTSATPAADDPQVQSAQNASVISGYHSADARIALLGSEQLIQNAQAAFLYETNSETLMYAWNADASVAPASLVKIMTAMLAVEKGNLTDAVTVKESVIATVPGDAVSADLVADEVMTLEDLLYCMMVGSANDAAAVIADHISGSQTAFVQLMNDRAKELGCNGTQFVNPHGLHDEQQYTTARDVAKILAAAMDNEIFATVFGAVYYTVPATNKSEARELSTGNFLMNRDDMQIYYDERVTGGRTGTANDGTRCLAVSSEANGMQLISIVIGSKSEYKEDGYTVRIFGGFNEAKALLDAGYNGYKLAQVLYKGQVLVRRKVLDGSSDVSLGSNVSVSAVLPDTATNNELSFRYSDTSDALKAPVVKGDSLASVEVWYGNLCVAQTELYAMNTVQTAGPLVTPREVNNVDWGRVLLVVFAIAAVAVMAFFGIRVVARLRVASARKRSRRYRADRRRSR